MRRAFGAAALLTAAALLSGCTISLNGFSLGGRKTITGKGDTHQLIDCLFYAEEAGEHSLTIEDIHFLDGGITLTVDPTLSDNITFTAPQNLLDTLEVHIDHEAGIIRVCGNDRVQFKDADLNITLGVSLSSLTISGGAEVEADLPDMQSFTLEVNGAIDGNLRFDKLEQLTATINGAADLDLSGACTDARIEVNGAGNIDAGQLICTKADIAISGAGNCEIHVTDTLNASVSGIGEILYSGNPTTVTKSGGGITSVKEK